MKYLSVCSGIEAATCAWHGLGFEPVAFSEIEAFPSAVLAHHYPTVPNYGDMLAFKEWPDARPDILVGGTPCQSYSVAGLRAGLADPRGDLMLTYLAVAVRYKPQWIVWENVPGVLSSSGGRDFGTFLWALGACGYGWAYRTLDAQFFGVPQRRRRVFVVGCLGDWRRAAAVLFERHGMQRHPAPSRQPREGVAPTISARTKGGGGLGTDFDCDGGLVTGAITASLGRNAMGAPEVDAGMYIAHSLRRGRGDSHNLEYRQDGTANAILTPNGGRGGIGVGAVAFRDVAGSLTSNYGKQPDSSDTSLGPTLAGNGMQVRRLTPRECERLQGFPDDYTHIPVKRVKRERLLSPRQYDYREINGEVWQLAADGSRYKALGNSMAVPVMRWIGERLQLVDWICKP